MGNINIKTQSPDYCTSETHCLVWGGKVCQGKMVDRAFSFISALFRSHAIKMKVKEKFRSKSMRGYQ